MMASLKVILACLAVVFTNSYVSSKTLPMFVYENGETGYIPCIVRGESQAYFWKLGKMFNESYPIASFIHGSPDKYANETYGKHTVLGDGTLVIYRMTYNDVGHYYCRVVTKSSEYYGSAAVYIKALRNDSTFGIEGCESSLTCIVHLDDQSEIKLTCRATYVSSFLSLRWFNNSMELQGDISTVENEDGSCNISSILTVDYQSPSLLSCEAYGEAMDSEHTLVELKNNIAFVEISASPWMPVSVVLIMVVVIVIIAIIKVLLIGRLKKKIKGNTSIDGGESIPLQMENVTKEKEMLNKSLTDLIQEQEKLNKKLMDLTKEKERLNKTSNDEKKELNHRLNITDEAIKKLTKRSETLNKDNESLNQGLENMIKEFARRKDRSKLLAYKDEPQICLRIKCDPRKETKESIDRRKGVIKAMKENYKLTELFEPEVKQEQVFESLEDIVQSAVDGNMVCVVAFGAPKSGKTFTMSNSSSKDSAGIIPRAVNKMLECEKKLRQDGFSVKILATHLGTYLEDGSECFKFYKMSNNETEENIDVKVKGLKVEMTSYHIKTEEQVIDLLQDKHNSNEGNSDGVKLIDLFHINVDVSMLGKNVSKGVLSLATFHGSDATKKLLKIDKSSPAMSILYPLINDKACRMAIIATIHLDTSRETQETLEFVEKVREASTNRRK